jgi:hypothetical protein
VGDLFFNRMAAGHSLTELMIALQASGQRLQRRLGSLADSEQNRRILSHIIGIERWGHQRLRVALGEAFVQNAYDDFRPPGDEAWETLKLSFSAARRETIRLIGALERANALNQKVPHDFYGDLTVRGWLRYLDVHANIESRKMR